jgi:hypothetical protein
MATGGCTGRASQPALQQLFVAGLIDGSQYAQDDAFSAFTRQFSQNSQPPDLFCVQNARSSGWSKRTSPPVWVTTTCSA